MSKLPDWIQEGNEDDNNLYSEVAGILIARKQNDSMTPILKYKSSAKKFLATHQNTAELIAKEGTYFIHTFIYIYTFLYIYLIVLT